MIDLSNMSLADLHKMKSQIDHEIANFEQQRRANAIAHLDEVARSHGFKNASAVVNKVIDRRRIPVPKKYFNPENPEEQWSGRGRKPHWFIRALESGKSKKDLLISGSS